MALNSPTATVLDDPIAVTIEDTHYGEQRFVTVGSDLSGRILVVVYAYSGEEEIRLISARKATPKERRVYEEKGYCREVCGLEIFARSDHFNPGGYRPSLASRPERCIGCLKCLYICPDFAITIRDRLEK